MESNVVMLCAGNLELGEVDINRGIFQGDSLSPLVFFSTDPIKKSQGNVWVFRKQRED